jgi:hypothetical protein
LSRVVVRSNATPLASRVVKAGEFAAAD